MKEDYSWGAEEVSVVKIQETVDKVREEVQQEDMFY